MVRDLVEIHRIGSAPGHSQRGIQHPFASIDFVAHPQDQ
jgi:hypothetical protein